MMIFKQTRRRNSTAVLFKINFSSFFFYLTPRWTISPALAWICIEWHVSELQFLVLYVNRVVIIRSAAQWATERSAPPWLQFTTRWMEVFRRRKLRQAIRVSFVTKIDLIASVWCSRFSFYFCGRSDCRETERSAGQQRRKNVGRTRILTGRSFSFGQHAHLLQPRQKQTIACKVVRIFGRVAFHAFTISAVSCCAFQVFFFFQILNSTKIVGLFGRWWRLPLIRYFATRERLQFNG